MRATVLLVLACVLAACGGEEAAERPAADAVPAWYRAADCDLVGESESGRILRCYRGGRPRENGMFVREDESGRHRVPVALPRSPGDATKAMRIGHWRWAALSPDGSTLLAEWSAECEVPIAYLVPATGGVPRPVVTDPATLVESRALGWTTDGQAIVHFPGGRGCGPLSKQPGVYLIGRDRRARLVRTDEGLERSLAPRPAASLAARGTVGY